MLVDEGYQLHAVPHGVHDLSIASGEVTRSACGYGLTPFILFSLIFRSIIGVVGHGAIIGSRASGIFFVRCIAATCTRLSGDLCRPRVTLTDPCEFLEIELTGHLAVAGHGIGPPHGGIVRIIRPSCGGHCREKGRTDKQMDFHLFVSSQRRNPGYQRRAYSQTEPIPFLPARNIASDQCSASILCRPLADHCMNDRLLLGGEFAIDLAPSLSRRTGRQGRRSLLIKPIQPAPQKMRVSCYLTRICIQA